MRPRRDAAKEEFGHKVRRREVADAGGRAGGRTGEEEEKSKANRGRGVVSSVNEAARPQKRLLL